MIRVMLLIQSTTKLEKGETMTVLMWIELIAGGLSAILGILEMIFGDFWGILILIGGLLLIGMGMALDYISTIYERQAEIIKQNGWDRTKEKEQDERPN